MRAVRLKSAAVGALLALAAALPMVALADTDVGWCSRRDVGPRERGGRHDPYRRRDTSPDDPWTGKYCNSCQLQRSLTSTDQDYDSGMYIGNNSMCLKLLEANRSAAAAPVLSLESLQGAAASGWLAGYWAPQDTDLMRALPTPTLRSLEGDSSRRSSASATRGRRLSDPATVSTNVRRLNEINERKQERSRRARSATLERRSFRRTHLDGDRRDAAERRILMQLPGLSDKRRTMRKVTPANREGNSINSRRLGLEMTSLSVNHQEKRSADRLSREFSERRLPVQAESRNQRREERFQDFSRGFSDRRLLKSSTKSVAKDHRMERRTKPLYGDASDGKLDTNRNSLERRKDRRASVVRREDIRVTSQSSNVDRQRALRRSASVDRQLVASVERLVRKASIQHRTAQTTSMDRLSERQEERILDKTSQRRQLRLSLSPDRRLKRSAEYRARVTPETRLVDRSPSVDRRSERNVRLTRDATHSRLLKSRTSDDRLEERTSGRFYRRSAESRLSGESASLDRRLERNSERISDHLSGRRSLGRGASLDRRSERNAEGRSTENSERQMVGRTSSLHRRSNRVSEEQEERRQFSRHTSVDNRRERQSEWLSRRISDRQLVHSSTTNLRLGRTDASISKQNTRRLLVSRIASVNSREEPRTRTTPERRIVYDSKSVKHNPKHTTDRISGDISERRLLVHSMPQDHRIRRNVQQISREPSEWRSSSTILQNQRTDNYLEKDKERRLAMKPTAFDRRIKRSTERVVNEPSEIGSVGSSGRRERSAERTSKERSEKQSVDRSLSPHRRNERRIARLSTERSENNLIVKPTSPQRQHQRNAQRRSERLQAARYSSPERRSVQIEDELHSGVTERRFTATLAATGRRTESRLEPSTAYRRQRRSSERSSLHVPERMLVAASISPKRRLQERSERHSRERSERERVSRSETSERIMRISERRLILKHASMDTRVEQRLHRLPVERSAVRLSVSTTSLDHRLERSAETVHSKYTERRSLRMAQRVYRENAQSSQKTVRQSAETLNTDTSMSVNRQTQRRAARSSSELTERSSMVRSMSEERLMGRRKERMSQDRSQRRAMLLERRREHSEERTPGQRSARSLSLDGRLDRIDRLSRERSDKRSARLELLDIYVRKGHRTKRSVQELSREQSHRRFISRSVSVDSHVKSNMKRHARDNSQTASLLRARSLALREERRKGRQYRGRIEIRSSGRSVLIDRRMESQPERLSTNSFDGSEPDNLRAEMNAERRSRTHSEKQSYETLHRQTRQRSVKSVNHRKDHINDRFSKSLSERQVTDSSKPMDGRMWVSTERIARYNSVRRSAIRSKSVDRLLDQNVAKIFRKSTTEVSRSLVLEALNDGRRERGEKISIRRSEFRSVPNLVSLDRRMEQNGRRQSRHSFENILATNFVSSNRKASDTLETISKGQTEKRLITRSLSSIARTERNVERRNRETIERQSLSKVVSVKNLQQRVREGHSRVRVVADRRSHTKSALLDSQKRRTDVKLYKTVAETKELHHREGRSATEISRRRSDRVRSYMPQKAAEASDIGTERLSERRSVVKALTIDRTDTRRTKRALTVPSETRSVDGSVLSDRQKERRFQKDPSRSSERRLFALSPADTRQQRRSVWLTKESSTRRSFVKQLTLERRTGLLVERSRKSIRGHTLVKTVPSTRLERSAMFLSRQASRRLSAVLNERREEGMRRRLSTQLPTKMSIAVSDSLDRLMDRRVDRRSRETIENNTFSKLTSVERQARKSARDTSERANEVLLDTRRSADRRTRRNPEGRIINIFARKSVPKVMAEGKRAMMNYERVSRETTERNLFSRSISVNRRQETDMERLATASSDRRLFGRSSQQRLHADRLGDRYSRQSVERRSLGRHRKLATERLSRKSQERRSLPVGELSDRRDKTSVILLARKVERQSQGMFASKARRLERKTTLSVSKHREMRTVTSNTNIEGRNTDWRFITLKAGATVQGAPVFTHVKPASVTQLAPDDTGEKKERSVGNGRLPTAGRNGELRKSESVDAARILSLTKSRRVTEEPRMVLEHLPEAKHGSWSNWLAGLDFRAVCVALILLQWASRLHKGTWGKDENGFIGTTNEATTWRQIGRSLWQLAGGGTALSGVLSAA